LNEENDMQDEFGEGQLQFFEPWDLDLQLYEPDEVRVEDEPPVVGSRARGVGVGGEYKSGM
jgi:hypothetical protein